jgi:V/A-type H+-transporting ATPase subunit I
MRGDTAMVGKMLVLCVLIGVAHLMLGMMIGLRNAWVAHGAKHAILEKGGWILILAGLTLFSFSAVPKLLSGEGLQFTDAQSLFGLAMLATGVAMAFAIEGINTILELPGLMGNLLSYSRIYAIGLSSVGIALAFNEYMAIPALEAGGIGVVIGVLVLIAGHALNLGLGIIGPLIQTLRLHYVEFFTKFYKGGGVKFNPLRYNRKHTKEV